MNSATEPRFLRHVLIADAVSCLAVGALQVALTAALERWLRLPAPLLTATGWFLLAYASLVVFIARRDPLPRSMVWVLVAGNFAWAGGCLALLVGDWVTPTAWGYGWILAQAACVIVLAELQWSGLRRTRRAAWA